VTLRFIEVDEIPPDRSLIDWPHVMDTVERGEPVTLQFTHQRPYAYVYAKRHGYKITTSIKDGSLLIKRRS